LFVALLIYMTCFADDTEMALMEWNQINSGINF
jgi:hypothetical protein